MDRPLHALGLVDAVQGLRSGRFTAEAYTRALLDRTTAHDAAIQAWAWLDAPAALQAARRADAQRQCGTALGALHGIPVGVKDIYATAGVPTEMGSPAFAGHVPRESARVVEQLQAQGAFVMGKTVTTECAFIAPARTRNPWNGGHTPGGSSSGSAAAVAAGFVPAALGTQTNGSVIRPAAFCGVVGFKPTQGALPIEGALTFSHTLDQPGVFTRGVEDAAWFASALCSDKGRISPTIAGRSAPPRLALVEGPVWEQAEEHARQDFRATAEILRAGGAAVEACALPPIFGRAHAAIRTIMAAEAAFHLRSLATDRPELLSTALRDFIAEGAAIGAVAYQQALALRQSLRRELQRLLAPFDALITPPTTGEAPATLAQTGNAAFCSLWSLCGVPALAMPTRLGPSGLPLGLQIVSGEGADDALLSTARWCETRLPFVGWNARPAWPGRARRRQGDAAPDPRMDLQPQAAGPGALRRPR